MFSAMATVESHLVRRRTGAGAPDQEFVPEMEVRPPALRPDVRGVRGAQSRLSGHAPQTSPPLPCHVRSGVPAVL